MDANIYQAPEAELCTEAERGSQFYVVSPRKFLVLYFATFGFYGLYWFYKHWSLFKRSTEASMWPVMRAIFSIFFTHSLFELFSQKIEDEKREYVWDPKGIATTYVVFAIISGVLNRMVNKNIGAPIVDVLSVLIIVGTGWPLYLAQKAANAAHGDVEGASNAKFTAANIVWLALSGVVWLLVIVGLVDELAGIPTFII